VPEKETPEEQIDIFEKTMEEKPVGQMSQPLEVLTKEIVTSTPDKVSTVRIRDEVDKETDQLIAEVMAVLGETEEIIVGKETTKKGEKTITMPIEDIEKKIPVKDKLPKVSSDLERVLKQINIKLDSITDRLKDLELEISHVKQTEGKAPEKARSEIKEMSNELDLLAQLPFSTQTQVKRTEEQKIAERIKSFGLKPIKSEPPTTPKTTLVKNKDEILDQNQQILESLVDMVPTKKLLKEIKPEKQEGFDKESQYNELIEIPDEEPLVPLDEEESNAKLIGTELSSAMISELKELSEETEEVEESKLSQPLEVTEKEKSLCPICGEEMKYIRQYNKYYCVKCGRYVI